MTASRADIIGLWFALVFPSSFVVLKYLGWESTIAYAIVVAAIVAFMPHMTIRLSDRGVWWLVVLTIVLVVTAFALVYPIANAQAPGAGSDDDDALNAATMTLLKGGFPYAVRTYLGNAVHHLPGAFLLASPFVLLGTSALQNLFWLPLFFVVVRIERDSRTALSLALMILALSPVVLYEIVTGTGYTSNAISVLLGLWWLVRTEHRAAAAVIWGVTLSSRANFIFLLPLAFAVLLQEAGVRTAVRAIALSVLTIASLTAPFYLHDPSAFAPLEGANRLLVFDRLLPHLGLALIVATAALAVGLAFRRMNGRALFRHCALVQAFPVVAGVLLSTIGDGRVNLTYARYGAFFAWFVFLASVLPDAAERKSAARYDAALSLTGSPGSADKRVY